jgi:HEAT repeat protein
MRSVIPVLLLTLVFAGCDRSPESAVVGQMDRLLRMKRPHAAIVVANGYLDSHPQSPLVQKWRILAYVQAEQFENAETAVQDVPESTAFLEKGLARDNPRMRETMAKFIATYGVTGVSRNALLHGLSDTEPGVRAYSAKALGRLYPKESLRDLYKCLQDENWLVRAEAARALAQVHDPRIVGWLTALVGDADPYVRFCAWQTMKEQPRAETVAILTQMLPQGRPGRRLNVALALAYLGETNGLPVIKEAMKVERTGRWLIEIARDLPVPIATNVITESLNSPIPNLRIEAGRSLERVLRASEQQTVFDTRFVVEPM